MNHLEEFLDPELTGALKRDAQWDWPEFSDKLHGRIMQAAMRSAAGDFAAADRRFWLRRGLTVAAAVIILAVTLTVWFNHTGNRTNPAARPVSTVDMATLLPNPGRLLDQVNRQWQGQLTGAQFTNVQALAQRLTDYALYQLALTGGPESPAAAPVVRRRHSAE